MLGCSDRHHKADKLMSSTHKELPGNNTPACFSIKGRCFSCWSNYGFTIQFHGDDSKLKQGGGVTEGEWKVSFNPSSVICR